MDILPCVPLPDVPGLPVILSDSLPCIIIDPFPEIVVADVKEVPDGLGTADHGEECSSSVVLETLEKGLVVLDDGDGCRYVTA